MWKSLRSPLLCRSLVMLSTAAAAQSTNGELTLVRSATCTFEVSAVGDWTDGAPAANVKRTKLSVRLESINVDEGTAAIVGDYGRSDVIARLTGGALHVIQTFREGALYTTTVFPVGVGAHRFLAVHSRHEFMAASVPGYTSRPEQYYGACAIEP